MSDNSDLDPNNFMINAQGGLNFEVPLGNQAFFIEAVYGWNPLLIKSTSNSPTGTLTGLRLGAGLMF